MTKTCNSVSFIFEDSAGEKERLEKAIVYAIREADIQNKIALTNVRATLPYLADGTRKQCLRIQIDSTTFVTISCITVGNFLYVSIFREDNTAPIPGDKHALTADEIFKKQCQDAVYSAILVCCEKAFSLLGISEKEVKA